MHRQKRINCATVDVYVVNHLKDQMRAQRVADALRTIGWVVKLFNHSLFSTPLGLGNDAERARCILVLWSRLAVPEQAVSGLATIGRRRGVLVGALLGQVKVDIEFEDTPTADLTHWQGDLSEPAFTELVGMIRLCLQEGKSEKPEHFSPIGSQDQAPAPLTPPVNISPRAAQAPSSAEMKVGSGDISSPVRPDPAPPTRQANRGVFLCYRRSDTEHAAGRLSDQLIAAYGVERVFMDIDSVPLGTDFVDHVTDQISKCSAVIVMIGPQWLKVKDKHRRRRLDNNDDLVRAEIAAALQRKVHVIPVLVQNAEMPAADELPDNIRSLTRRNGFELSATRWRYDVERLIKELNRMMKE